MSEQGERLNIRKATLRHWRQQFATHLREQGVAANATERAVRGQNRTPDKDGIYRAMKRMESTHEHNEVVDLVNRSPRAFERHRQGKEKLEQTRLAVVAGWRAIAQRLQEEGDYALADTVEYFVDQMVASTTDEEQLAERVPTKCALAGAIRWKELVDRQVGSEC